MRRLLIASYIDISSSAYNGGGWVGALIKTLSSSGEYEVGVMFISARNDGESVHDGVRFYPIYAPLSYLDKLRSTLFHRPRLVRKIGMVNKIVNEFAPDMILLFGLETEAGAIVSHIKDVPVVVHIQGILSESVLRWFPKDINPSVLSMYSTIHERIHRHTTYDFYKEACARAADEKALFRIYRNYLGRTDWDRKSCLKYSRDAAYFQCDELLREDFSKVRWSRHEGIMRISTICNGEIYKGFDNILKTASILKERGVEYEWNVYGVNPDNLMVRLFEGELKEKFSDKNVCFRGRKTSSELAEILAQSSMYVHPSHTDNSPNSVCEAMMAGTPVVAMNVGGVSSIIDDGRDGFLIEDYDCEALAECIISLWNDPTLCSTISANARERAEKRHSSEHILGQLDAVFNSLVKR